MVNKKIKYGILGCGKHALQSHAIPCKNLANLELTAICDISEKGLSNFEESYEENLEKFTNLEDFLNADIDAVLIGTPDEYHYENLRSCILANKHVFVEKPLATKSKEVLELPKLLSLASSKKLVISSCHLRRYDPPFIWLKDNLNRFIDKFGKPIHFEFDFSYHKPSKGWKHSRGLLLDHANHEIDLVSYLFGYSDFDSKKLSDSYDHYHVIGKRKDNLSFEFTGSRKLDARKYLEWAKIRFEKGDISLDTHLGFLRVHDHNKNQIYQEETPVTDYDLRGKLTLVNFADAISKKSNCYLNHKDLYINTALSVFLSEKDNWKYENGRNN